MNRLFTFSICAVVLLTACMPASPNDSAKPAMTNASPSNIFTATWKINPTNTNAPLPALVPSATYTLEPTPTRIGGGSGYIAFGSTRDGIGGNIYLMNMDSAGVIPDLSAIALTDNGGSFSPGLTPAPTPSAPEEHARRRDSATAG